jgi:hypothetical protein
MPAMLMRSHEASLLSDHLNCRDAETPAGFTDAHLYQTQPLSGI